MGGCSPTPCAKCSPLLPQPPPQGSTRLHNPCSCETPRPGSAPAPRTHTRGPGLHSRAADGCSLHFPKAPAASPEEPSLSPLLLLLQGNLSFPGDSTTGRVFAPPPGLPSLHTQVISSTAHAEGLRWRMRSGEDALTALVLSSPSCLRRQPSGQVVGLLPWA